MSFSVALAFCSVGFVAPRASAGQGTGKKPAPPVSKPVAEPIVSKALAHKYFVKAETVMRSIFKASGKPASSVKPGTAPLTRAEFLAELDRLRKVAAPHIKSVPVPVAYDASRLVSKDPRLASLIKGGYVAKISPLATMKADKFTASQFGDALGFFLARVAETTYTPSSKWTPILQPFESY